MTKEEQEIIEKCRQILDRGHDVEIKKGSDGSWVIYDHKKKRVYNKMVR